MQKKRENKLSQLIVFIICYFILLYRSRLIFMCKVCKNKCTYMYILKFCNNRKKLKNGPSYN